MSPASSRSLNRALLARQGLLAPLDDDAVRCVEHLFGLQSQNPDPPYHALWTRLATFDPATLSAAVGSREVVRIALHRSTIHAVTARDAVRLRPLLQAAIARMTYSTYGRFLADVDRSELAAAAREAMEQEPLSLGGLGEALARRWPGTDRSPQFTTALGAAARAEVPLVQVPPRGVWGRTGPPVHLPLDVWRPDLVDLPPMTAAEALVRYLAAFGPATLADAQKCLGITGMRSAAAELGDRLVPLTGPDGARLLDLAELVDDPAASPPADLPAPARLLAPFDAAVLSHADRRRILGDVPVTDVITVNGQVKGTVLLDGLVAGTWYPVRHEDLIDAAVTPLRRWTQAERAEVDAEVQRLRATLHP